ncbi:ABC transporter permease [Streptomyces sp. NPDC048751]|uniref:ABC transporter permease n=1 Tax=Streptomyces sp. NPDC048751 TaxID=3365591 RepID=UPI0037116361
MSTTISRPAPTATAPAPEPRRTAAVLDLARFEARELLLQAPILVIFGLYVVYRGARLLTQTGGTDDYPILNQADRATQAAPLFPALAVLICVNAAALRSRKNHTAAQFEVHPMEPWRRTLAHVLSTAPYAVLTALVVAVDFTWKALKPGAIGHGSFGELAVGPLIVLLSGVLGVLLARLLPSTFVPMVFVIFGYLGIILASGAEAEGHRIGWLSPLIFQDNGGDPIPADLLGRPAGWHALYLAGLCVLLACVTVLVSGGRTRVVKTVTAIAVAVTAVGAIGQVPYSSALEKARETASKSPEKVQSCAKYAGSTFCSFPEWNSVRGEWAEVAARVRAAAGGQARNAPLTVRQRIDTSGGVESDATLKPSRTPGQVTVGTRWGGNRVPELAVGVASVLVTGTEDDAGTMCDARMITVMWLAVGTAPHPLDTFRDVRLDDSTSGSAVILAPTDPLTMTTQQTSVLRALIDRPRAEVESRVKAHWTELTSPKTTTAQAAKLLGVEAPKGADNCEE